MSKRKQETMRRTILDRLDAIGRTRNWLARTQKAAYPDTVRKWLYVGTHGIRTETLEELFRVVGLEVKP